MNDPKPFLDRGVGGFDPSPEAYKSTLDRIDRRRRNRRISSALLALVIAVAIIGPVLSHLSGGGVGVGESAPTDGGAGNIHRRSVTLTLSLEPHPFGGGNGLIASGWVKVPDGFNACRSHVTVKIQHWNELMGSWKAVGTRLTSREGKYKKVVAGFDPVNPGKYRAWAPQQERHSGHDICVADRSAPVVAPLG